jgi:hypothetical protein
MVIFNSYVSLPEGIPLFIGFCGILYAFVVGLMSIEVSDYR